MSTRVERPCVSTVVHDVHTSNGCSSSNPQRTSANLRKRDAHRSERPARQSHPQDANQGVVLGPVRLPRACDNYPPADIEASATERWDHPLSKAERNLRYGTGQPEQLTDRARAQPGQGREHREPAETVRAALRPQKRRHRHDVGPAVCTRPERYQGRVTEPNTYQLRWTSSGRRAPHRTPLTVHTSEHPFKSFARAPRDPAQYEWVARRGISRKEHMSLPRCHRCNRVSVLSPCRRCATAKESEKYPELPTKYEEVS